MRQCAYRCRVAPRNLIYCLADPVTHEIRYVGQTSRGLPRASMHWSSWQLDRETNIHKRSWIRNTLAAGSFPLVGILETVSRSILDKRERYWIRRLRSEGSPLTNVSDGGQQARGYRWSAEGRRNQSWAQRKRFASAQERKRSRDLSQAVWASDGYRQRMRKARKKQFTPDVRQKIARTLGGRPIKDQHGRVYATIAEAVRQLKVRRSGVQRVLRKRYTHTGGYVFTYAD